MYSNAASTADGRQLYTLATCMYSPMGHSARTCKDVKALCEMVQAHLPSEEQCGVCIVFMAAAQLRNDHVAWPGVTTIMMYSVFLISPFRSTGDAW